MKLILASQSPRRRRLIELLGHPVTFVAAAVDEESIDHPEPDTNVIRTAKLKAEAVSAQFSNALIIAADTTVAVDGEMLGKPANRSEAQNTLERLRGRAHQVYTGLVLLQMNSGRMETSVCRTDVYMRIYNEAEVEEYVDSGDPFDKAGAYAIQSTSFHPVNHIEGCYTNVVGLPLCQLCVLLGRFGILSDLPVAAATNDFRECATCIRLMSTDTG